MTRNVLTMKESLLLAQFMQERYTASKLDNVAFTKVVNSDLEGKFRSPLTPSHVKNMLISLDMKPNRVHSAPTEDCKNLLSLTARVTELELQISKLAKKVQAMNNDMSRSV